jgi:hypothetical protein
MSKTSLHPIWDELECPPSPPQLRFNFAVEKLKLLQGTEQSMTLVAAALVAAALTQRYRKPTGGSMGCTLLREHLS